MASLYDWIDHLNRILESRFVLLPIAVIYCRAIRRAGIAFEIGGSHQLDTRVDAGNCDRSLRHMARSITRRAVLSQDSTVAFGGPDADRFLARCRDDLRRGCLAANAGDAYGPAWILALGSVYAPALSQLARKSIQSSVHHAGDFWK